MSAQSPDFGNLDFWQPLLGPALFIIGALVAFVVLMFVLGVVARIMRAVLLIFVGSRLRFALSTALSLGLGAMGVVSWTTLALTWGAVLGALLALHFVLDVLAEERMPGPPPLREGRCPVCNGSEIGADGRRCGTCVGHPVFYYDKNGNEVQDRRER